MDQQSDPSATLLATQPALPGLTHFRIPDIPPAAWYIPDFISADEEQYLLKKLSETPQPKWKKVGSGRRLQYWGGNLSKNGVLVPEPLPDWLASFPDIVERIDSFLDAAAGRSDVKGKRPALHNRVLGINQVLVNEYEPGQGISPHEDGPAFRPMVATLSLGSHTVLDIHHYLSEISPSPPMIASPSLIDRPPEAAGRPIAAIPLAHLLLLPRSLLILSSSLYAAHLHGIASQSKDSVKPGVAPVDGDAGAVVISNAALLGDARVMEALREKNRWEAERGVRTSLTFRHAEKTLKGGAFKMVGGRLNR